MPQGYLHYFSRIFVSWLYGNSFSQIVLQVCHVIAL